MCVSHAWLACQGEAWHSWRVNPIPKPGILRMRDVMGLTENNIVGREDEVADVLAILHRGHVWVAVDQPEVPVAGSGVSHYAITQPVTLGSFRWAREA